MGLPPIVVMGVTGSGKSTVAEALAERAEGAVFIDADDLHPQANVEKMRAGHPLDDVDRAPWLDSVGRAMREAAARDETAVVACSALKRAYRRRILAEAPEAFFVLLEVGRDELRRRMASRRGHFMPFTLLESQLDTLEPIAADEPGVVVDTTLSIDQVVERVLSAIEQRR